jgi:hypothetical protein
VWSEATERGCSSGVEHNLAKVRVVGSNPIARSNLPERESNKVPGLVPGLLLCAGLLGADGLRRPMNIPDPKTFTDPEKLRKLMANAVRLGYPDLAFECQLRIAEIAGASYKNAVERAFWTSLTAAEEFRTADNGRSTRLLKIRAKHKRVGAQKVLADLMMEDGLSDGFDKFVEHGRSDLTGEAIVLQHEEQFSVDVVNAARKKLLDRGVAMAQAMA